jgi:adenylate cyclase
MDTGQHSFLFADLAGFTSLTERLGDERAADLAIGFASAAQALAAEHRCEVVKTLGDGVMVRGRAAADVVALGRRLAREGARGRWMLPVRVGVHTGGAARRGRDYYGAAVNLAARLCDAAAPGEVLLSDATRARMAARGAVQVAERGERSLKNVAAPLRVFAAA